MEPSLRASHANITENSIFARRPELPDIRPLSSSYSNSMQMTKTLID